ncbi:hypothetical protein ABZ705_20335 [Streptomyces sp. NPDC006984]|uniref:hypothetical protein n=1 Tax=Streptomyces sp. NPDC006984 TaxID=3155463 RepID=UPI0033DAB563
MADGSISQDDAEGVGPMGRGYSAYVPDAVVLEAAEAARKQLEALGLSVEFKAKWWGFEVHLNQEAVDALQDLRGLIADIVGEFLTPALGAVISLVVMAQDVWVKAVSRGNGCKLVSPWFAPTMLIPVRLGPAEDTSLYWTVYEPGQGWNEDQKFTAHHSGSSPALAEYNGNLYCVHRGYSSQDENLYWTVFNPDTGWSEDRRFPGPATSAGPALAVFNGKLHCIHKGSSNDQRLFHTTFDGTSWSQDTPLASMSTRGPALAVFGGKLHLVHRSGDTSGNRQDVLWHAIFDGARWTNGGEVGAHSASDPALAVYGGKLHLVHRGGGNDVGLYHATYDGTRWSAPGNGRLNSSSLEGPGLAVFDNKLYCIHRGHGSGDQDLYCLSYNGTSWVNGHRLPNHRSGTGPAAIAYRDKNGSQNQLMVLHRGAGTRAAGADTAETEARYAAEQAAANTPDTP